MEGRFFFAVDYVPKIRKRDLNSKQENTRTPWSLLNIQPDQFLCFTDEETDSEMNSNDFQWVLTISLGKELELRVLCVGGGHREDLTPG